MTTWTGPNPGGKNIDPEGSYAGDLFIVLGRRLAKVPKIGKVVEAIIVWSEKPESGRIEGGSNKERW